MPEIAARRHARLLRRDEFRSSRERRRPRYSDCDRISISERDFCGYLSRTRFQREPQAPRQGQHSGRSFPRDARTVLTMLAMDILSMYQAKADPHGGLQWVFERSIIWTNSSPTDRVRAELDARREAK